MPKYTFVAVVDDDAIEETEFEDERSMTELRKGITMALFELNGWLPLGDDNLSIGYLCENAKSWKIEPGWSSEVDLELPDLPTSS